MQVYPAIDIQDGAVRPPSNQASGEAQRRRPDPLTQAEGFVAEGARWLHVVDMDRARRTGVSNGWWIRRICAIPGTHGQIGGNVDTAEWAGGAIEAGAARAVLGSAAAQSAEFRGSLDLMGLARAAVNIDSVASWSCGEVDGCSP